MLINLACLSVFPKQPSKNPLSPHPYNLAWHPRLRSTLPLTRTGVAALSLGSEEVARTCAGVDSGRLDDDAAIFDEFLDVGAGVGVPDFSLLSGVEPDFSFADASYGRGEAFL